jgi:hypothetical protein
VIRAAKSVSTIIDVGDARSRSRSIALFWPEGDSGRLQRETSKREAVTVSKKTGISIDDIDPQEVPDDHQSFMLLLPVGETEPTETGRTAEETTIKGNGVQKDRGIEFDYPKAAQEYEE